jgi:cytochrome c2
MGREPIELCLRLACLFLVVLTLPARGAAASDRGDASRGERAFQRCYSCHSVDPNEGAKLQGPSLYRIIGRPAGALPNFEYSAAMKQQGALGLVWDVDTLDRYVADPESVVAGTMMSVPPMRDEQERADLIAYLALSGRYGP